MKNELKYHHLGIPTNVVRPNEEFLKDYNIYVSGYETSEYKIEWMRFLPDCKLPEIVKTIPHVAFEVEDLNSAIENKNVIIQPNMPSENYIVAFIEENGAPIEFIQKIK